MKKSKYTYLYTFNHDVLFWAVIFVIRYVFGGKKLHWQNGFWCEMKGDSWFQHLGVCLGHGGLYADGMLGGPGIDTGTEFHEQVAHGEQFEAAMLRGLLYGLAALLVLWGVGHLEAGLWAGWAFWQLGWFMYLVPNWLVAVLRGEDAYWGSTHEESAYAQTDKWVEEHDKD